MTNSINNPPGGQNPQGQPSQKLSGKEAAKKQGFIRWGAVGPFVVFFFIVFIYFAIFFDTHARHALQYFATEANGAEVDIGMLHTSFWNASLNIEDIQVTNAEEPLKNSIQIGAVRWNMLWDALLRGKIAIEEASILNIQIGTTRKTAGRVLPKDPPSSQSEVQKLRTQTIDNAEKEFSGNMLGDIASLLNGADPKDQLKSLEGNLKSEAKIKELQASLKVKEQEWKDRLQKLPQSADIKALGDRIKNVKLGGNNPAEIQNSIKEIDSIVRDTDSKLKEVQATGTSLNSDLKTYQDSMKDLEALVQKDASDLESRFKIPKIDATSLSGLIFGPTVLARVKQAEFYMAKARHYMPPKKTGAEKAEDAKPTPHEREKGRNYKFGRPRAYPLLWLKKAEISSKSSDAEFSGDLQGTLANLTDDPPLIGFPTTLSFKGDFPKQKMFGVSGLLTIDHTTEHPREALDLKVADYTLAGRTLVSSPDAHIGFTEAKARSTVQAELEGENVKFVLQSSFDQVKYDVAAKGKVVNDILLGVFNGLPKATLQASVTGTWQNLHFNIDSNLGRELQKGLQAQIQAKINAARSQLQSLINSRIGADKDKLNSQFKDDQNSVQKVLGEHQAEIDKLKGQLDQSKNQAGKDQSKKLQDQGKKTLEDLKKKFKF